MKHFSAQLTTLALSLGINLLTPKVTDADPIAYELSGLATGTLGSTPFTDTSFTFTGNGDTTGVVNAFPFQCDCYLWLNPLTEATIELSGFPTSAVVDPSAFYDFTVTSEAGLFLAIDQNADFVIYLEGDDFASYDLTSPVGPLAVTQYSFSPFDTTEGTLDLTSVANLTFTANVTSSVPEPSLIWPLAGGIGWLAFGLARKRFARMR